jgi:enoyl-CoA hydratase/carnithine racemase
MERLHDRVNLDVDAYGVARVTLSRPDKMNALDAAMFDGLILAADRLRTWPGLRAVALHGEGRAFCAGLDMANFAAMGKGEPQPVGATPLTKRTHGDANRFQQVAWQWRTLPVPVVAAVHGVALGGGLQIALGADVRYVAADARLSVLEIKWGLVPDMAGMALLRELVRGDVARELTFSGRMVSGDEAVQLGLATRVCADPWHDALEFAHAVAERNPDAVRGAKRLLNQMHDARAEAVLLAESVEQAALIGSPNQREAAAAALAQRAPVFKDED